MTRDSGVFRAADALVRLGVGKNMVESIRYWTLATGMVKETNDEGRTKTLAVSDLGNRLLANSGYDPFMEDDATLWIIHWNLVTNPARATTWYAVFNLLQPGEFTRESLADGLTRWAQTEAPRARLSAASLEADISCFVRSYLPGRRGATSTPEETLDCPLASLGLLTSVSGKSADGKRDVPLYRFSNKPKPSLPPAVFAYALAHFWNRRHDTQETLSLREIVHGEASPGRVFRLNEDATLAYLDALGELTGGKMQFADTAIVRQVNRTGAVDSLALLERYYVS